MDILLDAIKLNHDPATAHDNALNIRRNATEFIDVPEWRRGVSVNPEDSPAAYSRQETAGSTLTIQARFEWLGPAAETVEVRALDGHLDPPGPLGCIGILARVFRALFRRVFGNVLGEVKATSVSFSGPGLGAYVSFELLHTQLQSAGVGVRTVNWRWQYRSGGGPWVDFDTSLHRIYVLLETPTAPWQQAPYGPGNVQLPWTDVLDRACRWAEGAVDRDTAAGQVTHGVYDLGHTSVTYDCPNGGAPFYSYPNFDCTAFLERVAGGPGNGQYVNCSDCATIVSTFSNALGCDLSQSWMGLDFDLNPILAIGSGTWETACQWGGFWFHEVAWKGACTESDQIFDACLQVDADADPTSAPHTPLQPVNMVFGTAGSGDYRDRLSPAGNCDPMPWYQNRRPVF